jgi:DNA-binding MarR family transcriptional regulator
MVVEPKIVRLPCTCATLRRAARVVTQQFDAALAPAGLRATQYTLLHALDAIGGCTQGRLGQVLEIDTTTLSRTVSLLEKEGWVESVSGEDRRQRNLRLTRKGRKQLDRARPLWQQVQQTLRHAMGEQPYKDSMAAVDLFAVTARHLQPVSES